MNCKRSVICLVGAGALKLMVMVVASGAAQSLTIAMVPKTFLPRSGLAAFSSVATTSAELNLPPEAKVTSSRSFSVTEVLSALIVHSVARLGTASPSGVYSIRLS